ncbi:hypothetical protein [Pseudonocardia alni]|uniref:hypothetical protein n=1 Tax=Pseudonocardia alni TaxID=33907 RepID=UPI00386FC266
MLGGQREQPRPRAAEAGVRRRGRGPQRARGERDVLGLPVDPEVATTAASPSGSSPAAAARATGPGSAPGPAVPGPASPGPAEP